MSKHQVEQVSIEKLIPYANNARVHGDSQITQIASSIKEFGFNNPILIDENNGVIAGHGRLEAAKKLELSEVPCIRLSHLTENQRKAYILADNRIALNSMWDDELLKLEISDLQDAGVGLELMGFDPSEFVKADLDYSILDDGKVDDQLEQMNDGVRKAIQIEFELEHYDEAQELIKYWRDAGAYVGYMILNHLREEKENNEAGN